MVVVPEPSVRGSGSFDAVAIDGAVGPAGDQGANEAFGFAVGLGSVGLGAQMADPESATSDRVQRGAVGAAVVGEQPLDGDAVAGIERDGTPEKPNHGAPFLIRENFGVGQTSAVIDRDVHVLPPSDLARYAQSVGSARATAAVGHAGDPRAGATLDPSQLLDVDMDQLTRSLALVAHRGLQADTPELAHPDPRKDPETVESAMPSTSAISGPVNRNRRSAAIASTRCGLVRCGI